MPQKDCTNRSPSAAGSGEAPLVNAMTVDVEDYFHVSGFADRISPDQWDRHPSRVVQNTHRVMDVLDRHSVRGTFFVLGWVADRFPDLVRRIHRHGHEIGCHSFWHRLVYDLTPDDFREDVVRARDILQQITGEPVTLFRSPSFSITGSSLWALDILMSEGFTCDSSIYPVYHDRYGIPEADPRPHCITGPNGTLHQFPGNVAGFRNFRLAVSGGGYFRLYPLNFSRFCLERINRRTGAPFMFYIHPWELDPDQPRLPGKTLSRFRHYQNLSTTERKLDRLLPQFRFGPMTTSISSVRGALPEYSLTNGLYRPGTGTVALPETTAACQGSSV